MDPNLLYWKSHGQVSVRSSFITCRASSVISYNETVYILDPLKFWSRAEL